MTFLELAQSVLKEEKKPLTATEIWNLAVEKGYDKKLIHKERLHGLHWVLRFMSIARIIRNQFLLKQIRDLKDSI